ncbi:hypothetical protein MtrunA17_Chr5g0427071 [Medicago truncatula]|uniref:Transmembrane protein n=1 Tax=Medicago truncatula TaxID=3880 RepID=G7KBF6_MEDTR|nr:hypothetical protein MTR_5g065500 [Medicago truncatula]RHN56216.1 hypothetical protein MtrunA17_Chr5g0427071 [Medicago truncatula]
MAGLFFISLLIIMRKIYLLSLVGIQSGMRQDGKSKPTLKWDLTVQLSDVNQSFGFLFCLSIHWWTEKPMVSFFHRPSCNWSFPISFKCL